MTEVYDIIEGIILGGKPVALLKERKAKEILSSLVSFCKTEDIVNPERLSKFLRLLSKE